MSPPDAKKEETEFTEEEINIIAEALKSHPKIRRARWIALVVEVIVFLLGLAIIYFVNYYFGWVVLGVLAGTILFVVWIVQKIRESRTPQD